MIIVPRTHSYPAHASSQVYLDFASCLKLASKERQNNSLVPEFLINKPLFI